MYAKDPTKKSVTIRRSRILETLRAGRSATFFNIGIMEPNVLEVAGLAGVESVWICNEHKLNDWLNLANQVRAAKLHDIDTIVRVSKGSYSDYIKPFEADATALMVPHVASADEARQIVAWTRCMPVGRRPLDGGSVDGRFCQMPMNDYVTYCNQERFLIFQIESPEALENVEEIAAVPGFDALMFGPGDFSHLIGNLGDMKDPRVVAARKRIGAAARANGKWGVHPGLPVPRAEMEAEGYQLFGIGADVVGLHDYFRDKLAGFYGK